MNASNPANINAAHQYDVIIIGSGAGGAAAAYSLVNAGLDVLLIEKGPSLTRSADTLDINRVVHEGAYKSKELWRDGHGNDLVPEEYFNVGGKTKWYGAALLRYSRTEFASEAAFQCHGWPIGYDTVAPYYALAEQRLGAREFECEPDLQEILTRLQRTAPQWQSLPLPLGLQSDIVKHREEARHFDGFASPTDLKGDADTSFLSSLGGRGNFSLLSNTAVQDLIGADHDATQIIGVRLQGGQEVRARAILLAAGALHSPRLLQRYIESRQLQTMLPIAATLGRNLKMHLLTAVVAISFSRKTDLLRKTRLLVNDDLPHSSVQPLGFDGELISTLIPKFVPRFIARALGERAYGFFLQTEDGAHRDNRVYDTTDGKGVVNGSPVLDYDSSRAPASVDEHGRLISRFRLALNRIGMIAFSQRIGLAGTAHVSGTMMMGSDPATSVVDAEGRVHQMQSLYVVDGSVLPRSSRVNPSLSIYAWSLRVADLLAMRLKGTRSVTDAVARAS